MSENKVIYTHNCKHKADYHKNKYKHWAKVLTGIDDSKNNGYAFIGNFISVNKENLIPENSIVIEVCSNKYTAYRAIGDYQKEEIMSCNKNNLVSFIKELKSLEDF